MTHPYELKIINFMKTVSKQSVEVENLLLKPSSSSVEHFLRKMYEDEPNRPFTMRLSSIGRPLCQLQMEKAKAAAVDDDWNFPIRMMYGAIIEGLTVSILRHSGIEVQEEQTPVELFVNIDENIVIIKGTLDIVIDGKVWDVKSASPNAFANKFASYGSLREHDDFGYLPQLYGYSKARELPPGGWIVVDKSSGIIKVLPVPENYQEDMDAALTLIENNVRVLRLNAEFKRCFTDVDEKFRKRFTGNKILQSPCNFCKYRYTCYPGLQYLPDLNSTAYEKPYKHYTKITTQETNISTIEESEGP